MTIKKLIQTICVALFTMRRDVYTKKTYLIRCTQTNFSKYVPERLRNERDKSIDWSLFEQRHRLQTQVMRYFDIITIYTLTFHNSEGELHTFYNSQKLVKIISNINAKAGKEQDTEMVAMIDLIDATKKYASCGT